MDFLSDYLVTYSVQRSKQITDLKFQMPFEIKILERTNIYCRFNSKGGNFNVNQL